MNPNEPTEPTEPTEPRSEGYQIQGLDAAAVPYESEETQARRQMLSWLVGGGALASLASFLYPVLRFVYPPRIAEAAVNEVVAAKVQDLKPNSGKLIKFGSKPALLVRVNETDWKAFTAVCTHLNCTVQYQESSQQIWCACHNGMYDLTGRVVSGPPPKPLDEFAVFIRGEEVIISKQA